MKYEYLLIEEILNSSHNDHGLLDILSTLKNTNIEAFLPLKVKNNVNSIVILGRKATKEAYTKEDIDLLSTLSNQAAVAVENASLYNNMEEIVEEQTL